MQVTETSAQGLKRELKVVVPQDELGQRFATRISEVKDQVQLKGFRKGKVPEAHVKKLFGRSVMAEVLQQAVEETSRKAISDRNERPAHQPNINLTEDKDEIESVLSGKSDLAFTMSYEALPEIKVGDLGAIKLEREVADVAQEAVDKAVEELADRSVTYEAEADRAAGDGDRLTIDFVGSIDGAEFEGGKGEGVQLVLGQSQFIPGFAEGLAGAKAGEERTVNAKFPEQYPEKRLAGKDAAFAVKVKEVGKPLRPQINDEFAKTLGAESLAKMKELIRGNIASEYASVSRMKLKRQVLDALDKSHDFALPETLVSNEFNAIWGQVTESLKQAGKTFADEGKNEEELKAEYRKLAERRVRLGLLLAEIGDKAKVEVTREELRRALIEQANRYPEQQRRFVYEYYEKNPAALVELRAPIFEEKVVAHILEQAKPTDKKVSVEELMKPMEGDDALAGHEHAHHHHDHDHHHHDHDHGHHDHHHDHGHDHHHHDHGDHHHDHAHKKG